MGKRDCFLAECAIIVDKITSERYNLKDIECGKFECSSGYDYENFDIKRFAKNK